MTLQELLDMAADRGVTPAQVRISIGVEYGDDDGWYVETDEPVAHWEFHLGETLLLESR